jgi:hypothetical protein
MPKNGTSFGVGHDLKNQTKKQTKEGGMSVWAQVQVR